MLRFLRGALVAALCLSIAAPALAATPVTPVDENNRSYGSTNPLISGGPLPSSLVTGQAKLATPGTQVCLSAAALVNGVTVQAFTTNVGKITIGLTGVNNTVDGTGNGKVLVAGQPWSFAVPQLSLICFNGTNAGDAIDWSAN